MLIGLTGSSGSGKSTVAALFKNFGYRVIDCDALVHALYEDPRYARLIGDVFGEEYLSEGAVNRKKLGALVFSDKNALQKLNDTVSPFILRCVREAIATAKRESPYAVLDAPLLFEYGLETECDTVVGVTADVETAVARLSARDGKSEDEIRARLASQHNAEFFRIHCNHIIENNGDAAQLADTFAELLKKLRS